MMKKLLGFILFSLVLLFLTKTANAASCQIQINGYILGINKEGLTTIHPSESPDYQSYTIEITGVGDSQDEIMNTNAGEYLVLTVYDESLDKAVYETSRGDIVPNSNGTVEITNFKIEKGFMNIKGPLTFKLRKKKVSYSSEMEKKLFEANEANTLCSLKNIQFMTVAEEYIAAINPPPKTTKNTDICDSVSGKDKEECERCVGAGNAWTALGCLQTSSSQNFTNQILTLAIAIAGGIAFLLIIFGGLQIILSSGNPEKVKAGKEMITAAIGGLLLIIFSIFILQLLGRDILKIPGFK